MSDELAAALREMAARHETPPRVDAAGIRDRARRRSRRRRVTAVLGTAATAACALTAVAFTLHTGDPAGHHQIPGAASATPTPTPTPTPTSPAPAPAGVLDLGRHTLTVGDRVMRVDSHSFARFPDGSRMTVVAKAPLESLPLEGAEASGADVKVPYLVELRTPDREPVYVGALAFDVKALAAFPAKAGWAGMSVRDAEWFYRRARVGDRIEITSTPAPGAAETTATPRYTAPTPGHAGTTPGHAGTAPGHAGTASEYAGTTDRSTATPTDTGTADRSTATPTDAGTADRSTPPRRMTGPP
ncbi:hypothetical protein [Streptomyces capillispiralis]|uniref:Uncharacterized protein n=1 Tax=Streptomyces capillispiralis TaxID=68182 RepID=A0A561TDS7_9ACTN|nr:hypothetical protein [Streptomyces capillispiralis]TWF85245.1 hypothetical protein FHX78_112195 [Streptomyces capillispiralis]GHH90345.1 hypothetical protein GCM10017779_08020 [Streptomyces capillispiralis]